ncbi:hypothetical protein ABPG75_009644 [Micractinium tetrahymenae]
MRAGPNYWERRWGSRAAPIIIEAADGAGTVTIDGVNMFDCRHFYWIGIKFQLGGDHPLHCERCINLLLRNVTIAGICPRGYRDCGVQEAAKLNQCQGVWVEHSEIYNGWNAAFDCMACQYGHVLNSRIHSAGWCAFVKGGSAYWRFEGNEVFDCLTSGISAGQGSGFNHMVPPWLQWDVYDLKVVNNYVHDVTGAGLGVWGCYDCLFAYNTLVRVGSSSHTIEVNFGPRSCDGDNAACAAAFAAGGWGPTTASAAAVNIPNQNILFFNNLVYNPPPYQSQWQHIQVQGPAASNTPRLGPAVKADTNLVFRGNLFWNGPADHLLGLGDSTGCRSSNPTCKEALILSQNYVNTRRPALTAAFHPAVGSGLGGLPLLLRPLPAFPAWAAGNSVPAGTLGNAVAADRDGASRATAAADAPGAWVVPKSGPVMAPPPRAKRPPPPLARRPPPSSGRQNPPPPSQAARPPPSRPPPPKPVQRPPPVRPSPPASHGAFWLPDGRPFTIGSLSGMTHLWVDPRNGVDGAGRGSSRANALKTLAAAWQRVPASQQLTSGWHIHISPGALTAAQMPNYWESRWGSLTAPIIIQAADGAGTVTLASMNVFDVRHLYLISLTLQSAGDVFHCERCTHLLLRNGLCPRGYSANDGCGVQETVKLNQCQGVWVEGLQASGAWDNAFDCVACQYGHILNSRFSKSEWGLYLKGGSAYFLVAGNEFSNGGTTAFAAGQGTGFEFMTAPWIQYEAYDIKFVNNLISNITGAGFGSWGCYNCLFAYNTLVRVGSRSHLIEVLFGSRSCDGDTQRCAANHAAGGWGPTSGEVSIPNKHVYIVNNVIFNPPEFKSQWQHFAIDNPRSSGDSNLPGLQRADDSLVIRGNAIWNGGADMPLGVDESGSGACSTTNPTCNAAQLRSQNAINTLTPDINLATLRPASHAGALATYTGLWDPIPSFGAWAAAVPPGPAVPPGMLANAVAADKEGTARTAQRRAPGALLPPP